MDPDQGSPMDQQRSAWIRRLARRKGAQTAARLAAAHGRCLPRVLLWRSRQAAPLPALAALQHWVVLVYEWGSVREVAGSGSERPPGNAASAATPRAPAAVPASGAAQTPQRTQLLQVGHAWGRRGRRGCLKRSPFATRRVTRCVAGLYLHATPLPLCNIRYHLVLCLSRCVCCSVRWSKSQSAAAQGKGLRCFARAVLQRASIIHTSRSEHRST
jgi:hypothetical protein